MYIGRSAAMDGPDVTSTVAPTPVHVAPRRPLGSVASETRMVVLLDPGSVIERGPGIARSQCSVWYERLTVDGDCGSGFWRVRNSVKSGRVVPSPKVQERAGDLVPTWVSSPTHRGAPGASAWSKRNKRAATRAPVVEHGLASGRHGGLASSTRRETSKLVPISCSTLITRMDDGSTA